MLPRCKLLPFWKRYFKKADDAIKENFWGNLSTLKRAHYQRDSYAQQLVEMGYCFDKRNEKHPSFYNIVAWTLKKLSLFDKNDLILPGKAFVTKQNIPIFVCLGSSEIPHEAKELNLLSPSVFVKMVASGFFPIGQPIREHTNQTLCEHDVSHIAGFINNGEYMKAVRRGFCRINDKLQTNPQLKIALCDFNSIYSLRLYYMIEVIAVISPLAKKRLECLVGVQLEDFSSILPMITSILLAKTPPVLNCYLYRLYDEFPRLVNPLGGESRDILNRTRKFTRSNQAGFIYSTKSNLDSKFDGSSLYSMYFNAKCSLENKRSNHLDYKDAIKFIHAPFIAALIGTSQLTIQDWVDSCVEEIPNKNSAMYRYICQTGIWNESHVIFWAFGHPDYTKILRA